MPSLNPHPSSSTSPSISSPHLLFRIDIKLSSRIVTLNVTHNDTISSLLYRHNMCSPTTHPEKIHKLKQKIRDSIKRQIQIKMMSNQVELARKMMGFVEGEEEEQQYEKEEKGLGEKVEYREDGYQVGGDYEWEEGGQMRPVVTSHNHNHLKGSQSLLSLPQSQTPSMKRLFHPNRYHPTIQQQPIPSRDHQTQQQQQPQQQQPQPQQQQPQPQHLPNSSVYTSTSTPTPSYPQSPPSSPHTHHPPLSQLLITSNHHQPEQFAFKPITSVSNTTKPKKPNNIKRNLITSNMSTNKHLDKKNKKHDDDLIRAYEVIWKKSKDKLMRDMAENTLKKMGVVKKNNEKEDKDEKQEEVDDLKDIGREGEEYSQFKQFGKVDYSVQNNNSYNNQDNSSSLSSINLWTPIDKSWNNQQANSNTYSRANSNTYSKQLNYQLNRVYDMDESTPNNNQRSNPNNQRSFLRKRQQINHPNNSTTPTSITTKYSYLPNSPCPSQPQPNLLYPYESSPPTKPYTYTSNGYSNDNDDSVNISQDLLKHNYDCEHQQNRGNYQHRSFEAEGMRGLGQVMRGETGIGRGRRFAYLG